MARTPIGLILGFLAWTIVLGRLEAQPAQPAKRPNVVLLVSDDLAATLGCYGHPLARTPNLDAFARKGLLFQRAYCQFPHCNPSRASMLSGLRPGTTRVTNNAHSLYDNVPEVMTLPHYFRARGYVTMRCGKIFHLGVPAGDESMDDPKAWDRGTPFRDERPYPKERASEVKVAVSKGEGLPWSECPVDDAALVDGALAKTAITWLRERDRSKPFFLAVGFHRPHLPFVAPARYFDLYPFNKITVEPEAQGHEAKIPLPARNGSVPQYAMTATLDQRRAAVRAYLACVSYVDAQVGEILAALSELGLEQDTLVIFTSDHGWHLGEHGLWHKRSLFEECARVPLILSAPGMKTRGQQSAGLVELLDLYPTLCDLAGLEVPQRLQGKSLRPVLEDAKAAVHDAAFTEARRGLKAEYWGRSVRTARWRYTEWDEGRNGIELYNHDADPRETANLAADPSYAQTRRELSTLLQELHSPK